MKSLEDRVDLLVALRDGLIALGRGDDAAPPSDLEEPDPFTLLTELVRVGGSALHIAAGAPPACRIGDALCRLTMPPLSATAARTLVEAILDPHDGHASLGTAGRLGTAGDMEWSLSVPGVGRFRCYAFQQRGSISAVIRVVPHAPSGPEELGLPPSLADLVVPRRGIVLYGAENAELVASGVASLVASISGRGAVHIVTLERPITHLHRHQHSIVTQREVGLDVASFAEGVTLSLRWSPDVLALSDLGDASTYAAVTRAAGQGVLVIAGLTAHGDSLAARFAEVFPRDGRGLAADHVRALIADHRSRSGGATVALIDDTARASLREGRLDALAWRRA